MSTTYPDELKIRWYKQKYYLDQGFLKPIIGGRRDEYNPFDLYKQGNRAFDSLHFKFADLNLKDDTAIESFYSRYGPLGFFNREILKVVSYNPSLTHLFKLPNSSPVAGVHRFSDELIPMDDLIDKFHIPTSKLPIPNENDVVMPISEISSFDTWESVDEFKRECASFKMIVDFRHAVAKQNYPLIRKILLENCSNPDEIRSYDNGQLLANANFFIIAYVNTELDNMVSPCLDFDQSSLGISKNITWRCNSLLTALYMMLFVDITRGASTCRCSNEKCRRRFEPVKPGTKYCCPSCQTTAKTRRSRKKSEVVSLWSQGKSPEEISNIINIDINQIKQWIEVN